MSRLFHGRFALFVAVVLVLLMALPAAAAPKAPHSGAKTVADFEFLGEVEVPSGTMFAGTVVGGLSSITYDRGRGVFYAVSDDQGNRLSGDPVRFYAIDIDLADGWLDPGDVTFVDDTQLYETRRMPFAPGGLDPEGFVLAREGQLYLSSEGNIFADPVIQPFIRRYNPQGRMTGELPLPAHFFSNGIDHGVRFNLGFESLNLTPNGRYLVTAGEGALFQDGAASTSTNGSLARVLVYNLAKRTPVAEYAYPVSPWAESSAIFGVNGIAELLPIDNAGTMLVMERSFSIGGTLGGGSGNYVTVYEASTAGATDVLDVDALASASFTPMTKSEVFTFEDYVDWVDNIEGMTFGPDLPDGRKTLVFVSDDNFSDFGPQTNQFIVFAVELEDA